MPRPGCVGLDVGPAPMLPAEEAAQQPVGGARGPVAEDVHAGQTLAGADKRVHHVLHFAEGQVPAVPIARGVAARQDVFVQGNVQGPLGEHPAIRLQQSCEVHGSHVRVRRWPERFSPPKFSIAMRT